MSTHPTLSKITEGLQAQLRKAGITLDMQPVDHPTWHQQIRKDLSPIVMYQASRFPVADVLPDAVLPLAADHRHADGA